MEAAPVSFRRIRLSGYPSFTGDGTRRRQVVAVSAAKRCPSGRSRICGVGVKFSDEGHAAYYRSPSCGGAALEKKMKEKGMKACNGEAKELKKKLKVVKGLAKKLSDFSEMGLSFVDQGEANLSDEARVLAKAAEGLLGRLQRLREAEKEAKRRRKEEKTAACMKKRSSMVDDCESSSSSSSSESSDSECQQVINMGCSRRTSLMEPKVAAEEKEVAGSGGVILAAESSVDQAVLDEAITTAIVVNGVGSLHCLGNKSSLVELAVKEEDDNNLKTRGGGEGAESSCCGGGGGCGQRIEVCMGGKCRKSGAAELLQEFQRMAAGLEEAVVGCKCMGKCKAGGPNVRLRDPVQARPPSLCIGVGLEDVASIVSNFLVEDQDHLASPPSLVPA